MKLVALGRLIVEIGSRAPRGRSSAEECLLPKQEVVGSTPIARSKFVATKRRRSRTIRLVAQDTASAVTRVRIPHF